MSFLRRLIGGAETESAPAQPTLSAAELEDAERQHELDVAREEARRLTDLQQRQLKYADRSWTPPRQGGERRADDEEQAPDE